MIRRRLVLVLALAALPAAACLAAEGMVEGQETAVTPATAPVEPEEMIQLNLPENLEVKVLVDYVGKRLNLNLLYDEAVGRQRVTIAAATKIPRSSLMGLLQSVLKMAGLAIVEAEQPGWMRIVADKQLLAVTGELRQDPANLVSLEAAIPVTQVFEIHHTTMAEVDRVIRPFLSQPGGNSFAIPQRNLLVVTDYAGHVRRVASVLALLDQPPPAAAVQFVPVEHWPAADLAAQVTALLAQKRGVEAPGQAGAEAVLTAEPRSNRIILVAPPGRQAEALGLIAQMDTPSGLETRAYTLVHVAPQRVDGLARSLIGAEPFKGAYTSTIDADSNRLFVTAPPAAHERLAELVGQLDVPADRQTRTYRLRHVDPQRIDRMGRDIAGGQSAQGAYTSIIDEKAGLLIVTAPAAVVEQLDALVAQLDVVDETASPIRFYRLTNASAAEVLATIRALESNEEDLKAMAAGAGQPDHGPNHQFTGPNLPPGAPGQPAPPPPVYVPSDPEKLSAGGPVDAGTAPAAATPELVAHVKDATVTVDLNTNTLIVMAPPAVQATYERLIRALDRRRPQVMVEVILVTIDTSNNFSLGVELFTGDTQGDERHLIFSAFGLSDIRTDDGGLELEPGLGFNGTVIQSDDFAAVVRALATESRAKVVAAPRILVNDNGTATLTSVNEAPFVSVNASDTVSTTSFAGYASAGTTVTITPHISEGDHLRLQYAVTLNSFTGEGAGGIPPPRQTNALNSEVTVPDGHAVIVGGLTREDSSRTKTKVPLLGDIPVLDYLFSSRTRTQSNSTLFAFIRPVVLRDDRFEDLKYLSQRDLEAANMPADYPAGEPMLMQ